MPVQIALLPFAIAELFAQVSYSGKITLADRYGLMAAVLNDSLDAEDRDAIDRLFYALRKGRLKIVKDISVVL